MFETLYLLIKSLQTGLLLTTGIAGYLSANTRPHPLSLLNMVGSLFVTISGSTILNMEWVGSFGFYRSMER